MPKPLYVFNERAKRYKDQRGRFVSQAFVEEQRIKFLAQERELNRWHAQQLWGEKLALDPFIEQFRDRVRRVFSESYIVARGGRAMMTPRDWGILGNMLKFQYDRIYNFFGVDLASGRYTVDQLELVIGRMNLYLAASGQAWQRGKLEKYRGTEQLFLWKWMPGKDHCKDCLWANGRVYTADGWLQLGLWPQSPRLACIGLHCGCMLFEVTEQEVAEMRENGELAEVA